MFGNQLHLRIFYVVFVCMMTCVLPAISHCDVFSFLCLLVLLTTLANYHSQGHHHHHKRGPHLTPPPNPSPVNKWQHHHRRRRPHLTTSLSTQSPMYALWISFFTNLKFVSGFIHVHNDLPFVLYMHKEPTVLNANIYFIFIFLQSYISWFINVCRYNFNVLFYLYE